VSNQALVPSSSSVPATAGFVRFDSIAAAIDFANFIAKSDLVPSAFRNKPADIVIAMQFGMELGLSPLQSLQSVAVVNGKPSIYGDAIPALIIGQPDCDDFIEDKPQGDDPEKWIARCTIKRRGKTPTVVEFSWADAKRAKLTGKTGPWQEYPKRQMQMRARSFAARDSFPDRLKGIIVYEEAIDYPTDPAPPVYAEPKRTAAVSVTEPPAAEAPPVEAPPAPVAAVAPKVPRTMTHVNLAVVETVCMKDDRGLVYVINTDDGAFYTRERETYDTLALVEGTDHRVTLQYRNAKDLEGGKSVRVITSATVDEVPA
jgi:hypothetical protein